MAQEIIDYGGFIDDPTADIVRDAFEKTDNNFTELYGELGGRIKGNERFIPYISTPGQTVLENVLASINAYNVSFSVAANTVQIVSFIEYFGGVFTTEYIKRSYLLKPGYTSYGALTANTVTAGDLFLLNIVNTTPGNLYALGDTGGLSVSDFVNATGPYLVNGLTAFSATISAVDYLFIFSGVNGSYGTGATPTTADNFIDINAQDPVPIDTQGIPPLKIASSAYTVVVGSLGRLLEFTANDVTVTIPVTLAEEAAEAGVLSSLFRAKFQGTGTHTINAYNGVSEAYTQGSVVWAELIGNDTEGWYLKEWEAADVIPTPPIPVTYADLAALIAGQGAQIQDYIYEVTDASGFTGIDSGRAWVKYLGTVLGTEADYRVVSKEEAGDMTKAVYDPTNINSDAFARANHTGTQTASTISDFAATVRSTVLTGLSLASATVIAATDTVLAALGQLQAQITALPSATQTLTNKRITMRVQSVASSATVTPNADNDDAVKITAQAAALTLANPSGTPTSMQPLTIRIKDNGTARAITYGTQYRAFGQALPATTVLGKTTYLGLVWNSDDSKWDAVGNTTEV